MKKEYISSAKRKIIGILLVFIVPLLILLFSYNWYVMRYVYTNTVQHAERTLEIYSQPVVNELSVTEEYFEYIVRKDLGFRRLIYADTERRAIARLKDASEKLSAIYSTALNMTGHIIYHSGSDQFISYYGFQSSCNYVMRKNFTNLLIESMEQIEDLKLKGWFPYEVEGQVYLIHFFHFKGTAVLGIYDLNLADVPAIGGVNSKNNFIYFADENRQPITLRKKVEELGIELKDKTGDTYRISTPKQHYLVMEKKLDKYGIYMLYVMPYYGWIIMNGIPVFFALFSLFVGVLLVCCIMWIHKSFIRPLQGMVNIMEKVKAGDMRIRLEEAYGIAEFEVAANTFNNMLEQIEHLKISHYEQELESQRIRMLYLQIQSRPHFVLNCMKNLFCLAQEKKYEEMQETILVLSQYLRYVLKNEFELISVQEELKNIENYIYLQGLSSAETVKCEFWVNENTLNYELPSLSILTFVENAVKYGKQIGKELVITVKVNVITDFLNVMVLDNGNGFSPEILKILNDKEDYLYRNGHIGIQNVVQRLTHIYRGKSEIVFSNADGACIEIFIPLERMEKCENGNSAC